MHEGESTLVNSNPGRDFRSVGGIINVSDHWVECSELLTCNLLLLFIVMWIFEVHLMPNIL